MIILVPLAVTWIQNTQCDNVRIVFLANFYNSDTQVIKAVSCTFSVVNLSFHNDLLNF